MLVARATQAAAKFPAADECQMNGAGSRKKPAHTDVFIRRTAPVSRKLRRGTASEYAQTIDFQARLKGI
jgi:hypothetical protein